MTYNVPAMHMDMDTLAARHTLFYYLLPLSLVYPGCPCKLAYPDPPEPPAHLWPAASCRTLS